MKPFILVVEDDESLQRMYVRFLRRHYEVEAFDNVEEPLNAIVAGDLNPDVIISDYNLRGGLTGIDFWRNLPLAFQQRFLLISGNPRAQELAESLSIINFLKPAPWAKVLAVLKTWTNEPPKENPEAEKALPFEIRFFDGRQQPAALVGLVSGWMTEDGFAHVSEAFVFTRGDSHVTQLVVFGTESFDVAVVDVPKQWQGDIRGEDLHTFARVATYETLFDKGHPYIELRMPELEDEDPEERERWN